MFEIKIYNFCPIDIEVVNLMKEIRKINKGDGFRLIKFEEREEIRHRSESSEACILVEGRRGKRLRRPRGCNLDCGGSNKTSILTYVRRER